MSASIPGISMSILSLAKVDVNHSEYSDASVGGASSKTLQKAGATESSYIEVPTRKNGSSDFLSERKTP